MGCIVNSIFYLLFPNKFPVGIFRNVIIPELEYIWALFFYNKEIIILAVIFALMTAITFFCSNKKHTERKIIITCVLTMLSILYICAPFYILSKKVPRVTGKETDQLIYECKISCKMIKELVYWDEYPIGQANDEYFIPGALPYIEAYICYAAGKTYYASAIVKYEQAIAELDKRYPLPINNNDYCKYFYYKGAIKMNIGFVYLKSNNKPEAIKAFMESIAATDKAIKKYKLFENDPAEQDKIKDMENFSGFNWSYYNLGLLSFDREIDELKITGEQLLIDRNEYLKKFTAESAKEYDMGFYCLLYEYRNLLRNAKDEQEKTCIKEKIIKLKDSASSMLHETIAENFTKKADEVLKTYPLLME